MKRVAIVFEEDIFNQKGTFHAKLERVRHLAARPELEVEVFCVQVRYTWIERLLLGKRWLEGVSERRLGRPERLDFDGVSYRMLWMPYSILDHFLFFKLGRRPLFYPRFLRRKAALLKGFDWLSRAPSSPGRPSACMAPPTASAGMDPTSIPSLSNISASAKRQPR